ncbi:hypothetical protein G6F22_018950 [Rhizopus arrhizus]|nr:hypothetical protein G6F22_018950 [Rhizopus arrhizus]
MMPPEAITGTETASAICGTSAMVPISDCSKSSRKGDRLAHGGGRADGQDAQFTAARQHVGRDPAKGETEDCRAQPQDGVDLSGQRVGLRAGRGGGRQTQLFMVAGHQGQHAAGVALGGLLRHGREQVDGERARRAGTDVRHRRLDLLRAHVGRPERPQDTRFRRLGHQLHRGCAARHGGLDDGVEIGSAQV